MEEHIYLDALGKNKVEEGKEIDWQMMKANRCVGVWIKSINVSRKGKIKLHKTVTPTANSVILH